MAVTRTIQENILILTIDNPPVNALAQAVRAELEAGVRELNANDALTGAVITGAGRAFIAGADIKEFGKPPMAPSLPDVIKGIGESAKPIVAAINGVALGGGLEVALGCHGRLAGPAASLGLPEVKLGIIPGAGGTQRLPRLVGLEAALEMITSGTPVSAEKALEEGLIDGLADGDLLEAARARVVELLAAGALPRLGERDIPYPPADLFQSWRKQVVRKTRGQLSPLKAIDALEAAVDLPFEQGLVREREIFLECMETGQRRALMHAFFAERDTARIPGLEKDGPVREVRHVAVIGGGTMGRGISLALAGAGLPVILVEQNEDAKAAALNAIAGLTASSVKRGRMSAGQSALLTGAITGTSDLNDAKDVDLVIEAVFEDMDVKKDLFGRLDAIAKPGAILATNTSYLDVDEIARSTARPADVIGAHFFSPAHIMRLLEVVRGAETADEVLRTVLKLGKAMKKVPVVSGVCPGFIGNRMLRSYRLQAEYLIEDGALPHEVDQAIRDFGMPMGPFAMADMAGLDIGWNIRKAGAASRDPAVRYVDLADRICGMGRFGQKTGAGWYRYEAGDRTPHPDPEIEAMILENSKAKGITRRPFEADEITERLIFALINEGAKILGEGIAAKSADIDMVYIHGYGFPAWRGGPMFWAGSLGLDRVLERIRHFSEADPQSWEPAPILVERAESGGRFTG